MFKSLILLLPWRVKRFILIKWFRYEIHPKAYIGLSYVFPDSLKMDEGSVIGHLNVCKTLDRLEMKAWSQIGNLNWITGYSVKSKAHYTSEPERSSSLTVGAHTHITHRHLLDCTNAIVFGEYTTFAGFNSQILTHSIDLALSKQKSMPVKIGSYCFIGTRAVLLAGSSLPDNCVLGAMSLLNQKHDQTHALYAGVPAKKVKELSGEMMYFNRKEGFVE